MMSRKKQPKLEEKTGKKKKAVKKPVVRKGSAKNPVKRKPAPVKKAKVPLKKDAPVKKKRAVKKKPVKKQEIVLDIREMMPKVASFTYDDSVDTFNQIRGIHPASLFLNSLGMNDVESFDGCVSIGMFFIHLSEVLNEMQGMTLFMWVSDVLSPVLVAHGVCSKVPSVVFSNDFQRDSYFKFCCYLGLGFLNNPFCDGKKIKLSGNTVKVLKRYGIR